MTPPEPNPARPTRRGIHRRVKRGIVTGYLHGLSQRHRAADSAGDAAAAQEAVEMEPAARPDDPTAPGLTT